MRRARLSTTQIYNTESNLIGLMSQNRGFVQLDQPVVKSYFQRKLKLKYQSISAQDLLWIGYVMLNLPVIFTPLRSYLYGQTSF